MWEAASLPTEPHTLPLIMIFCGFERRRRRVDPSTFVVPSEWQIFDTKDDQIMRKLFFTFSPKNVFQWPAYCLAPNGLFMFVFRPFKATFSEKINSLAGFKLGCIASEHADH